MIKNCKAIVLRYKTWGENDLLVTLLSDRGEKIECVAKGAAAQKSKRRSHLEHFNLISATLYTKNDRHYLQEATCLNCFYHVKQDLDRIQSAARLCKIVEEHSTSEQDPRWFDQVHQGLHHLHLAPWTESAEALRLQECLHIAGLGLKQSTER
jgi:DNA repair protein RecO